MNTQFLEKIESLTNNNAHTIARIEIAKHYELEKFEQLFHSINRIHELTGSMPYDIMKYRESITGQMLDEVERKTSKAEAEAIYQVL